MTSAQEMREALKHLLEAHRKAITSEGLRLASAERDRQDFQDVEALFVSELDSVCAEGPAKD